MLESAPGSSVGKVAIVCLPGLALGQCTNVCACIAAGLAAGDGAWAGQALIDASGLASAASSHLPITVLTADAARMRTLIQTLAQSARAPTDRLVLFPAYAQSIHEAPVYWAQHAATQHADQPIWGLGLAGAKKWVNSHVGSLPLLR